MDPAYDVRLLELFELRSRSVLPTLRSVVAVMVVCLTACSAFSATLGIRGRTFILDGKPFDMWGIRTASASQSHQLKEHLIAQLEEYLAHGVNTVDVFYMGSSGAYSLPAPPAIVAGRLARRCPLIRRRPA
jgi:hypothetical protein